MAKKVKKRIARNISYQNFLTGKSDLASSSIEIALFQRDYVWSKHHINLFLKSVLKNNLKYYIGNIIIQRSNRGNSGNDFVVDGQQRLVTLSLIIEVLKNCINDSRIKTKLKSILFEGRTPRITFSRKNLNDTYIDILKGSETVNPDESQKILLANFNYIKKNHKKRSH